MTDSAPHADLATPVMLDPIVAAVGLPAPGLTAECDALLAALSHHDPDHHPAIHAAIWRRVQDAACRSSQ